MLQTVNLSIIIPTSNSGKTIKNCLNSLIEQSLKPTEILIVDNLSIDDTASIVKRFIDKYSFIKWFSEKDNGIYSAMNKGIKLAKSEWLYFMGSDDRLYDSDVLKKVFYNCNTDFDVIYGKVFSEIVGDVYGGEFSPGRYIFAEYLPPSHFF